MWSIIGGSGFEKFEGFEVIRELDRSTPFGVCSTGLKLVRVSNTEAIFLPRHGIKHELLPSEVNYRANIYALKRHGATKLISMSAVGSLKKEYKPGDLVIPSQFIDRTKSIRKHTFCGEGLVGHVSLAKPVSEILTDLVLKLRDTMDFDIHLNGTAVCIEGPCFSTQAESKHYIQVGASIIGMTSFPEYALAREAGISYLPCSFISDYDCWDDSIPHVTLDIVIEVMKNNNSKGFKLISGILGTFPLVEPYGCNDIGLKGAIMTQTENSNDKLKTIIDVLTG